MARQKQTDSYGESTDEIELRPDGEKRFLAAVHAAAKSGPKHRPSKVKGAGE